MSIVHEERVSDSPYIESVTRGWTVGDGMTIRPAESHWHMVFTKYDGGMISFAVGPLSSAGVVSWKGSAEILWIKFKLGTFMPYMPTGTMLDKETVLPGAAHKSFWLNGCTWQFPNFDNVETFVGWLVHDDVLVRDPVVNAALQGHPQDVASRTVRHRFLRTTGLTQSQIRQIERAQQAVTLLRRGVSILDTVHEAGYFDQPHLTRALKQWVGHTPAQILRTFEPPACQTTQDSLL